MHIQVAENYFSSIACMYLQTILGNPSSITEHNNAYKRPEQVCYMQHFCLFKQKKKCIEFIMVGLGNLFLAITPTCGLNHVHCASGMPCT